MLRPTPTNGVRHAPGLMLYTRVELAPLRHPLRWLRKVWQELLEIPPLRVVHQVDRRYL